MRLIARLAEQITDEVEGALSYAKDALEYRQTHPALANIYHKLSQQEFEHMQQLHQQVQQLVVEAENSGVDYPQSMRDKWDKQHRKIISKMADANVFIGMWK